MDEHYRSADRIELAGTDDWYGSVPGLATAHVGGAVVVVAAKLRSAVYSRVLGLGLTRPVERSELELALGELPRLGAERAFVTASPYAGSELPAWLEELGVTRYHRGWMRFCREREPAPEARTDFAIRLATAADAQGFDDALCTAFETPAARGMFAGLVGRPRWHPFVALDGERVVGAASLFVDGDVGWMAFGGVRPESRKRGAQSALLAARIRHGLELGCSLFVTETGEAVPGDPQQSYANIQRAGFRELFLRPNYLWQRAPTT